MFSVGYELKLYVLLNEGQSSVVKREPNTTHYYTYISRKYLTNIPWYVYIWVFQSSIRHINIMSSIFSINPHVPYEP